MPEPPHELAALAALAIAGVSALESDGVLTFTVSLSRAGGEPVMVRYATEDGTATAGSDYAAASGQLTFAALSTAARTIVVTVRDDAVDEGAETFTVRLSDAQGATLAVAAATGTIDDDDVRAVAVQPAALNVSEGGRASYTVVLGSRPTAPVTVTVAAASEVEVDPVALVFTPVGWGTEQTVTVSAAQDDDALADAPVALAHVASGGDYAGAPEAVVQVTIVEDDVATLAVTGARAVEGAGNLRFAVSLSLASDAEVTVDYASGATGDTATAAADYAAARGKLVFARGSTAAQVIGVTVADDALDEPAEELTVTLSNPRHAVLAGGGDTAVATGTIEDDDDAPPELRIAPGSLSEGADERLMRFAVSLDRASGHTVTVRYATADLTAAAGTDYTPASGTLTFEPGQALTRTVAVPIVNDALDEPDEQFTVTLNAAVHATLAGGRTTTGTIADDDEAPKLTIAHASLSEGAGVMKFAVSLDPASGHTVTVRYATADGTATAGADYEAESGTLTFGAGTTMQSIAVPIVDDQVSEEMETFTVALSDPERATLSETTATGTITDDDDDDDDAGEELQLSSLQVTGGGTMYPAFDADIHHYALTCSNATTLQVTAAAKRSGARLTLLRDDSDNNHSAVGALDVQVVVNRNHDVAIELSDGGDAVTYVIHCLPSDFPEISVLTKTDGVSDGLLLVTPAMSTEESYMAVLDNNGVPRFHRLLAFNTDGTRTNSQNFRRHPDGRYSVTQTALRQSRNAVRLYNSRVELIESVGVVAPLDWANGHDFLIAPNGNYLFISYHGTERNLCEIDDYCDPGETTRMETLLDGVIQEVDTEGQEVFRWNSWDHVNVADCIDTRTVTEGEYSHLNSLHLVDGDIVASLRNCNQVLRIDRSSGTGAVEWQVGGGDPPHDSGADYLEIVGDEDGDNEFCKQHSATITASGSLLLFDNGVGCRGPRKAEQPVTRVVEYDISSGSQAVFKRRYLLPAGHGHSVIKGSVRELANRNWLIAWGDFWRPTIALKQRVAVSEVDPSGTAVLELNMSAPAKGVTFTYRAYRERETDIEIPWNLP